MPRRGVLDLNAVESLPRLSASAGQEPELVLTSVEVLQMLCEIRGAQILEMIPPSLHAALPSTAFLTAYRIPSSPFGSFTLAEIRLNTRAHDKPMALLSGAVVDSERASDGLAARFGWAAQVGAVRFIRHYDSIELAVDLGGSRVLDMSLMDPEPVPANPLPFPFHLNGVRIDAGARLATVPITFRGAEAERGRPVVRTLDVGPLGEPRIAASWPVAVWYAVGDLTVPSVDMNGLLDPAAPTAVPA